MKHAHLLGDKLEVERESLKAIWSEVAVLPELSRHRMARQLVIQAAQGMLREPVTSVLTLVTVSFVMFLLGAFLLLVINTGAVVSQKTQGLGISIYIKDGVDDGAIKQLQTQLKGYPGVREVSLLTKAQALEEFKKMVGDDSALISGLEDRNPLPVSLEVKLDERGAKNEVYLRIKNDFSLSPHVEKIQTDDATFGQIGKLLGWLRRLSFIGTIGMSLIVGLLISNTVRLSIFAHRSEIEIMELVGATDNFIRFPFLIEGAITGLLGSVVGIMVLSFVFRPLAAVFRDSSISVLLNAELVFLPSWLVCLVVLFGIISGVISSYLAARRFSRILYED